MRKFKKVSVKLIASLIAVIILISPINVLAAVISPKIDELLHSDEYIGASDAYLANANIQADDLEYYPETADILDEDEYYYNLDSENEDNEKLRAASSDVVGDPMVFYTQRWLNQEYGNVSGFGSVPESLIPILKNVIDNYVPNENNLLFVNKSNGGVISTSQVNCAFKRLCEKANLEVDGQHMLRHSYATRCIEAGISAPVLKTYLGHTDISTTINTYVDIFNKFQKEELKKYEEYMKDNFDMSSI